MYISLIIYIHSGGQIHGWATALYFSSLKKKEYMKELKTEKYVSFTVKAAFSSVQSLSHVRLCDPMNRSTPGFAVHQELPEFTQTHVHRARDAIQPSHPLVPFSSCPQSLPASESFPMSQLFA